MPQRVMLVYLNRPIRGEDEYRRLSGSLPIAYFHSDTGNPNQAIGVTVDADSRVEAENVAFSLVAAVVGPGDIVRVAGDDDTMQDRQVMFWLVATRTHLRSWELLVADFVRLLSAGTQPTGSQVWSAELAHHVVLVAGHNLLRALGNAEHRYTPMPVPLATEIEVLRNLHEHWDEQRRSFYDPQNPGPLKRAGKRFAELHPGRSPYWALGWDPTIGPALGPGLAAGELHRYLDGLMSEVLSQAPALNAYTVELLPAPWLGPEAGKDRWWPRTLG